MGGAFCYHFSLIVQPFYTGGLYGVAIAQLDHHQLVFFPQGEVLLECIDGPLVPIQFHFKPLGGLKCNGDRSKMGFLLLLEHFRLFRFQLPIPLALIGLNEGKLSDVHV